MSDSPALLGIDGGGTATAAWLADADGRVLGRGRAGPSNAKAVGADAARQALGHAVALAFEDAGTPPRPLPVACLGLAGFDRPIDRSILGDWVAAERWAEQVVLVNDGDLVLAAGTPEGFGLAVIGGTGSIAVGRNRDGRTARAGGWGPLLGDEGSAYALVLDALRLVARRADGRECRGAAAGDDPLSVTMCTALGVPAPGDIVSAVYAPGFDRARIAALAPTVLEATRLDPALVAILLEPAGKELAEILLAVARALEWPAGKVPVALAGSFLLAAEEVSRALLDGLRRSGYEPEATAVPEPVQGALILAGRALHEGRNAG
jgi:N-acetylglucosamine kinase-like BadF-type ATPase